VAVALAAAATTCSLATAQAAIRATKARVPSLAGDGGPMAADPKLADEAVCVGRLTVVSLASRGTAGDTAWLAFVRTGGGWRVVKAASGYKLRLVQRGAELEVVQPVYRRSDPNCCPTGGLDRLRFRLDGQKLVVTRRWHTP
jgi:hypothetical protein